MKPGKYNATVYVTESGFEISEVTPIENRELEYIFRAASKFYGIDADVVKSANKKLRTVNARYFYIAYATYQGYSNKEISEVINRDRTSINNAKTKHSNFIETDLKYRQEYITFIRLIESGCFDGL